MYSGWRRGPRIGFRCGEIRPRIMARECFRKPQRFAIDANITRNSWNFYCPLNRVLAGDFGCLMIKTEFANENVVFSKKSICRKRAKDSWIYSWQNKNKLQYNVIGKKGMWARGCTRWCVKKGWKDKRNIKHYIFILLLIIHIKYMHRSIWKYVAWKY